METIKTNQKSYQTTCLDGSFFEANDMEAKRQALYDEASNYLIQKVGYTGDLVSYADIYVDDKKLNDYTAERLAESYLSDEIGEFATAEEVATYLKEEYDIWAEEDPKDIATRLKWRGDIIQIDGVWYWNM